MDLDVAQVTATHENLAIYLSGCKTLLEVQFPHEWGEWWKFATEWAGLWIAELPEQEEISETSEGTVESRFYLYLPRKKIRLKRFLFQFILRLESGPGWIWTCINTTSKCFLNTSRDGDSITSLGRTLSYGIVSTLTNFIQVMLNFSCQYLLFTFRKPSLISHPAVTTGGAVPEHHTVWFLARDDSSPLSQHQLD